MKFKTKKECYDYLLNKLEKREKISIPLIKQIHKILTNGTYDEIRYKNGERPGEFKKGDYIIGRQEVDSDAKEVEKELNDLINEINESNSKDYLTIVSYFHCRFENIHPFADGNGRVGRTLINYYLMINDLKPLIIYEEDKREYYDALYQYDQNEDIETMKTFLEYCQNKTWQKKGNKKIKSLISYLININ